MVKKLLDFNHDGSKEIDLVRLALFLCERYIKGKNSANGISPLPFFLKSQLLALICILKMETTNKAMAEQTVNPSTPMQQVLKPEVTNKIINLVPLQQLIKHDRSMITMSEDNTMMKQIQATHAPDGREFDVRPLFQLVEDILNRATLSVDPLITVKHYYNFHMHLPVVLVKSEELTIQNFAQYLDLRVRKYSLFMHL